MPVLWSSLLLPLVLQSPAWRLSITLPPSAPGFVGDVIPPSGWDPEGVHMTAIVRDERRDESVPKFIPQSEPSPHTSLPAPVLPVAGITNTLRVFPPPLPACQDAIGNHSGMRGGISGTSGT